MFSFLIEKRSSGKPVLSYVYRPNLSQVRIYDQFYSRNKLELVQHLHDRSRF